MTYEEIKEKIEKIDCEREVIGKSLFGENIYLFHLGNKQGKQLFLSGGIHAREYISTLFLIEEMEYIKNIKYGCYVLPLANPDGVKLVLNGKSAIPDEYKLLWNKLLIGKKIELIKCNGRGVDLNVNFDAKWGEGKHNKIEIDTENFIGTDILSEPETRAISDTIDRKKFDMSLAFHSKGEVIYYGFEKYKDELKKDYEIAKIISSVNHYKIIKTKNSTGGLSDYMNYKLKKSAFTIELGGDNLSHPITEKHLPNIFYKNKDIPFALTPFLK